MGSNHRPFPYEGTALPLRHTTVKWWVVRESNPVLMVKSQEHRRQCLQPASPDMFSSVERADADDGKHRKAFTMQVT